MITFDRWPDLQSWAGQIDVTYFLRPEVVVGHENKATKPPDEPRHGNVPTRLFIDLSVKCLNGRFARIDPAAGELELLMDARLKSYEQPAVARQNRVGTGPDTIFLGRFRRRAKSFHAHTL